MFFRGRSKEARESAHEPERSPEAVLLDEATGLYEGWYFERRVREEVQRCARYGRLFALILWEPRLLPGEALEDEVVASVAGIIKGGLRQTDLAAQLERTRFAALLIEAEHNTARTVAFRMKGDLASCVRGGPASWRTGMDIFPDDGVDASALFQVATRRLSEDAGASTQGRTAA
jgi:GGDEF domain-containing protein